MRIRVAVVILAALLAGCAPVSPKVDPTRWRPAMPQYGLNVTWGDVPAESTDDLLFRTRATLDYAKNLNANSIAIAFPFRTPGPDASRVGPAAATPTPSRLKLVADEIVRQGFRLTLRPLLDEANLVTAHGWRGSIAPADRAAWFTSYRTFLAPYLATAQDAGVTTFDIGSEFDSLNADPRWAPLVDWARTKFHGELAYAQNWGTWQTAAPAAPVTIAVDAYPPMPLLQDSAPPNVVLGAWKAWLARRPGGSRGVVMQEVGLPAQTGAYRAPYAWTLTGHPLDLNVQARWFAAACQAQRAAGMGGIYYWSIDLRHDPALASSASDPPADFVGRPAETAIKDCFSGR